MTDEKILEVLDRYEHYLSSGYYQATTIGPQVAHLVQMIPQMRDMLTEGRREKLMRWLGFMQGVLWSVEIFTLEELMAHNKPDGVEFNEDA